MLRYKTETRPGLVALYDIWPGNGAGQFLQPRSPHRARAHKRMTSNLPMFLPFYLTPGLGLRQITGPSTNYWLTASLVKFHLYLETPWCPIWLGSLQNIARLRDPWAISTQADAFKHFHNKCYYTVLSFGPTGLFFQQVLPVRSGTYGRASA